MQKQPPILTPEALKIPSRYTLSPLSSTQRLFGELLFLKMRPQSYTFQALLSQVLEVLEGFLCNLGVSRF